MIICHGVVMFNCIFSCVLMFKFVFCVSVPLVLQCCTKVIETHGIVDGIYRLSGVASNIQKLRLGEKKSLDTSRQSKYSRACHPGGHYWDYCPDVLFLS